ncbi:hypothetical protein MMC19_005674 [Ptychographa xylographoides]|nr:hypothetical protein [Ptychographa xylographoides]
MSLARALTKRYRSQETKDAALHTPGRAASTRKFNQHFDRTQISLPIELISTTNVLVFDAPDLHELHNLSSASSATSFDDSSSSHAASSSSSISAPDSPSREASPVTAEPNHLSTYFAVPSAARSSMDHKHKSTLSTDSDAPAIPSRALSHTKKTHQALAHKRSMSRVRSPRQSTDHSSALRSSLEMFSSKPEANHPFGAELTQVNELAEEFGVHNVTVRDDEEQFLIENGLQKFTVDDYVDEIQGLFGGVFDDRSFPMSAGWI